MPESIDAEHRRLTDEFRQLQAEHVELEKDMPRTRNASIVSCALPCIWNATQVNELGLNAEPSCEGPLRKKRVSV